MTCYPINSYTSLKCMTCMWEMEIQQATILLKVRTSPRLYSRRRSWEWRPNNLCKWWQERQASHWLHADWVEQREGGSLETLWRGLAGPPGGEVRRCTLTYLPVQARQCLWWEQQGWYAAGPLLDREALSWEKLCNCFQTLYWTNYLCLL